MARIVDLPEIDVVEMDDEFLVIDADDTSSGPLGTDKRATTAKVGETLVAVSSGAIDLYDDTADGLAGTTLGDYFSVPSAVAGEFTILYRHDAGPVATEIKRLPSNAGVAAAIQAATDAEESAEDAAEAADIAVPAADTATTGANNATAQAVLAAASAQAAAEIVNISEVQTFTNPLARAVRAAMTAADSGSNGIQVLDNVQADYGTGNYTLARRYFLATTRPSANQILSQKHDGTNGRIVALLTTGVIRHTINGTDYDSTVALTSVTNTILDLAVVVTRSSASAAGSVLYYVNGLQLGASVTITAASPVSIDNAVSEYILGTSTTRTAGEFYYAYNYNRALSAAEALSLCINGVDPADVGASQVPVYESDFSSGVDGWSVGGNATMTGNNDSIDGEDDWLKAEKIIGAGSLTANLPSVLAPNKQSYIRAKIFNPVGSGITHIGIGGIGADGVVAVSEGASALLIIEYVPSFTFASFAARNSTGSPVSAAVGSAFYVKDVEVKQTGATLQLSAQDAQSNTGQVFDSSGNKNHALLPASGATVVGRPQSDPRRVEWPNTWAATSELQYVGGVNQPILETRTGFIVMDIFNTGGSVTVDVGDGVDQDRFVAAAVLATGPNRVTFASPFTDGTNRKLTIKPSASFTGTLITSATYQLVRAS